MKSPLSQAIVSLCACGVSIAAYAFWYSAVGEKSAVAADLETQIITKTGTASRLASSRMSLAEIAGDEATIRSYFVPETGVVAFIDSLQARGRAQGATVSVLSVSSSNSGSRPSLTFSLSISGTFDAVLRTMGAIEYAPYHLTVSGLSLGQNVGAGWRAEMNIVVGSVTPAKSATTTP